MSIFDFTTKAWKGVPRSISITSFSALVSPPGNWLMTAFQVQSFVDNSGDEIDVEHKVCSFAGYVTTVKKWRKFEKLWRQVLRKYRVPYLHMKEFAHHIPPFDIFWDNKLKIEKPERKEFLNELINVMVDCQLNGILSVTILDDLNRFNINRNIKIDALALNLYACMLFIDYFYPKTSIEMVIDKLEGPWLIIDKAINYAKTDIVFPGKCDYIQPHPLNEHVDFKKVPAIQAADFLAWEARKDVTTKKGWWTKYKDVEDIKKLCNYDINKYQYPRKSYEVLMKAIPPEGILWDYKWLEILDKARQHIWP